MPRPVAVTIFGILNIVYAVMGMFGELFGAISTFLFHGSHNPIQDFLNQNQAFQLWSRIALSLGFVASCMLCLAGVGLLKLKSWGRSLSIAYAIYGILASLAGAAMCTFVMLPAMNEVARTLQPAEAIVVKAVGFGSILGALSATLYPVILLIFVTRPKFKEAFRAPSIPPALPRA